MFLDLLRYAVFGAFVLSAALAVGSWALRTRRLNPFSKTGQFVRRATDLVLDPVETWQLKRGGNPQNAPWWLLGGSVVGGIVVVTGADWLARTFGRFGAAAASGPRGVAHLIIVFAGRVLLLALIVRVVGSWFGLGRYNRWIAWTYTLTDWIVRPLQRLIPPLHFGAAALDFTPLIAWFLLLFLIDFLTRIV